MKRMLLGVAAALAITTGQAAADGMPSSKGPSGGPCAISGNVGLGTDNVFRGISKTYEDTALFGAFNVACGQFYAGVAGSTVDVNGYGPSAYTWESSNIELAFYGGYKTK